MSEITFPLEHGLKLGDQLLKDCVLRDLTTADIIGSQLDAEKMVMTDEGPQLVASPTLAGAHMLRRQIVRIGNVNGPFTLDELMRLEPEDFMLIQHKADALDQAKAKQLKEVTEKRGRSDQGE